VGSGAFGGMGRGAAKVVGGWRKGMAAAGGAERSAGGRMARHEPPAAAMPFRKPCGWLPAKRWVCGLARLLPAMAHNRT